MMMFVPEEKVNRAPEWWTSERYDYCDAIMEGHDAGNLFNRLLNKISHLFS